MRRLWRLFAEHCPLAEALTAGLLAALAIVALRGTGLGGPPVEWALLPLLLLGFARSMGWQAMVILPGAVVLSILDGAGPGTYLLAGAGALVFCRWGMRLPYQGGDPVSRLVYTGRCAVGWLAVRLLLGGGIAVGAGVAGAVLLALVLWAFWMVGEAAVRVFSSRRRPVELGRAWG